MITIGKVGKIVEIDELARRVNAWRAEGKRVVHCHGVFDLVHVGHIRHFREARSWGDVLVVTITPDEHVNKGPDRPVFHQLLRAEVIAAIDDVDLVAVNRWPTASEAIQLLRPDIYAKGPDYADAAQDVTGGILKETEAVRAAGGEIRFTKDVTFSSSNLLNRSFSPYTDEVNEYLSDFRARHSAADLMAQLNDLRRLRVVVLGEAIIDEYVYCDVFGKAAKDPILAVRYLSHERFPGGALAVANHLVDFCASVDVVTYLGSTEPQQEFVRTHLKPGVRLHHVTKRGAPTVVKRRYVEPYLVQKLIEVYEINDDPLDTVAEGSLQDILGRLLDSADVVVVADFGHGLIGPRTVETLSDHSAFLAINTQINAANLGYHTISKYRRADYVCIHEGEIRLDRRDREADLEDLAAGLAERLQSRTVTVTLGKKGLLVHRDDKRIRAPALALRVVDRIGAGDAVFAITSLCAAVGMPADTLAFVGNVVGAQAVTTVGNSVPVDRIQLLKTIDSLLK